MEKKEVRKLKKEIERLEKELKLAKEKAEEYLNGWKRAKADYLNLEKKIEKEKEEWRKFANLNLVLDLLPVFDSFELAMKKLNKEDKKNNNDLISGLNQIKKQLDKVLEKVGVERIKTVGEKFNPEFHEIVEKRGKNDKIVEEIQAGYKMEGKVIRPAKVIVE